MAKKQNPKGFKDWYEEDEWGRDEKKPSKKTSKRLTKQEQVKRARREKNKAKQSFYS